MPEIEQMPKFKKGETVGSDRKYRIERELGKGGFGATYEAINTSTNAKVALKFLDSGSFDEARKEGSKVTEHNHEAVVKVLDVVEWKLPFIVMEFVEGQVLSDFLDQHAPLSPSQWWETFRPLLKGLHHLHAIGTVHRDIKPANIILRNKQPELPVIVDFGAARRTSQDITQIIHSQHYTDPMVVLHRLGRAKPGWDIYSLAVVSFEALFKYEFTELVEDASVPPLEFRDRMLRWLMGCESRFLRAIGRGLEPQDQRPEQVVDWMTLMVTPGDVVCEADPVSTSSSTTDSEPSAVSHTTRHTVAAKCRELEKRYGLPPHSVGLVADDGEPLPGQTSLVSFLRSWEYAVDGDGDEFATLVDDGDTVSSVCDMVQRHLQYPVKSVCLVKPDGGVYRGMTKIKTVRRVSR